MRWKGYEKKRQKSRWLAAGLAALMTMAAVCGCGGGETGRSKGDKADGSEGTVTGEDGQSAKYGGDGEAMGRYLEEESDLSEYLEGYRNHLFRLQDGKLVIAEPMQQLLVSEDNGATWTWEENDWLSPLIEEGNYIQSIAIGADGTKGVVYTLMDAAEGMAGDGQDEDEPESGEEQDGDQQESNGKQEEDQQEGSEDQNETDNGQTSQDTDAAAGGDGAETADDAADPDASGDEPEDSFQESAGNEWWISPKSSVLVVKPDGTQLPVEFPAAEEEYPVHIWIADNGRIFLGTYGDVLYEVKEDGSCERFLTLENSPQMIAFQGSRMIIDGYEFEGLLIYDMETQEYISDEVLDTFVKENYGDRTFNGGSWYDLYCFPGGEDVIYLAGKKGVHRHVIGGGAMEQIIDASLSSFGNPARHLLGMVTLDNNEFMTVFTDARLVRYVYDTTVPTVPNETVRAYSLTDNASLRQAISLYQAQNPEVYVEYEIGMEEGSAVTREDALKKLNTQIMAGEGPDLLVMDDLPFDSYVEKGMLADLTDYLAQYSAEEPLFDNVIEALKKDGKAYVAPATIGIPQIAAAADGLENVKDLSDLADVMEQLRQAHPDKDILGIGSASALLKRLAATSAPKWITADGSIDREVLQEYLEQCKRIYDIQMDGLDQETVETYQERMGRLAEYYGVGMEQIDWEVYLDLMSYLGKERHMMIGWMCAQYGYLELVSLSRNEASKDAKVIPMQGQCTKVFKPATMLAVSAASGKKDAAMRFFDYFLSAQAQSSYDGLPVNQEAFDMQFTPVEEYLAEDGGYSYLSVSSKDGTRLEYVVYWPDDEQILALKEQLGHLQTAYLPDSVLEDAVFEQGVAYMQGKLSLEQALDEIEQKVSIYMAE